jgi:hypothetical protein
VLIDGALLNRVKIAPPPSARSPANVVPEPVRRGGRDDTRRDGTLNVRREIATIVSGRRRDPMY